MNLKFKNPVFLLILNYLILMLLYRGIPIKTDDESFEIYFISFLCMSFDFFGAQSNFYFLLIGWISSVLIFSFFVDNEFNIAGRSLIYQIVSFIFTLAFLNNYQKSQQDSGYIYEIFYDQLFYGLLLSLLLISILFFTIFIKKEFIRKVKSAETIAELEKKDFISKCPNCGTHYNSNPRICYKCSKLIQSEKDSQ